MKIEMKVLLVEKMKLIVNNHIQQQKPNQKIFVVKQTYISIY